ncbi:InlB B-repeat-containing protein [Ruminococcoides intestinale]|uniref:InlB B-repeat-containing protein n=1 Tax=Ruminococcoides intestinale TaxID=3133162 RepID=UPI0032D263DF
MKTKISHLGRSTVSVILAVMMLLSTMLIGTISVNAADYFTVGDTLYLDISDANYDATADNAEFYIKFYEKGTDSFSWSKLSQIENSKVYSGTVPNGEWNQAVFTRVNGKAFNSEQNWDSSNIYSSADTTIADKGDKNCWSLNNGDMKGTWTIYSGGSGGGSTSTDYYIAGRFKTKWNADTTEYKFTESSEQKGLYYYDTEETVASLSGQIPEGIYGNYDRYFYIRSSKGKYLTSDDKAGHSFQNNKNSQNYLTLVTNDDTPEKRLIKFSDPSDPSNDKVTIWLDTTNNDMRLYYTAGSESSLTPVAQSVSLTASSSPVQVGTEVTLTASLNDRATGLNDTDVTYKFEQTSGATVTGTPNGNTYKFTPATADDYTFKVTASAANYSSVTNTVKVTATSDSSDKYAIHVKLADNVSSYSFSLWAYGAPNNTNAYGYNNWDSKETFTINDHEWHDYPFINTISNWNLIIFNNGTEKKYDGQYNSDLWVTVKGGNNYDVSTIAPTKYTVTYGVNGVNGTLSATGVSSSGSTVNSGTKVTFTANPNKGYAVEGWYNDAECTKKIESAGTNKTYTVTVNADTNVYVKFHTAETYTVTFSSSDETYGTISATNGTTPLTSPATVTEGDTVTFTAKPKDGYALSGWIVNGVSASSTANPYTITVNSNTTVVANFKVEDSGTIVNDMYFLYGSKNDPRNWEGQQGYNNPEYGKYNVYEKDGKYIVTLNEKHYKELYFAFSKDDSYVNMEPNTGLEAVNSDNPEGLGLVDAKKPDYYVGSVKYLFGKMSIVGENSEYIGDIKIIYDPTAKTYTVKATKDSASDTTVNITGKDGTIRAGFTNTGDKKTTAVLGDTTLSITTPDDKIITASDSYKIDGKNRAVTAKKVPYGSTVTVTTTINPDATFAGHNGSDYYVKGFSVNGIFGGVLSQTEGKNHSSDVYTYTFEVNQEIYGSKLEITPVYFLKNDDNCVYFYIENYDSAKQIWGNTPSCYVYYGSGTTTLEALGYYPGQPMVDYNGSIFTQIPKFIVNGDTTEKITGMTLNNYVWDDVHRDYNGKNQKSDNAQTYDYDDFVKIAESGAAADNIIYRFKYNEFDNEPADTFAASKADAAGWEVFLDYQNYPTDIFGNKIGTEKLDYKDTQSVTSKDNYLSIISDGYQNNYIGKYATAWSIYNKAGDRVATIPSSALLYALGKSDEQMETAIGSESTPTDFLPGKTDRDSYWATFKTLYNDYKGVYAQINFEAAIKGGDDYGNRLDGRWYYSQSKQKITGEIKIQYANTLDDYKVGGFHEDTFADEDASSIVGTTTGASAYFTDPADRVRKLETFADNTQDYKFEVNATSTAVYTFVGWYRLIDGDYKAINPSDMSSLTGAVTRNSDVTLVARYIKTPGGSMTFHHSLYNGTNAGGGKATPEIQVVVKNNEGKSLYDSGRIAGTASIDKTKIAELAAQTGLTVTVTLYTTTKNLYNFNGYYSAENTTDITAFNPTTGFTTNVSGDRTEGLVTTSEYTFSFNEYYNKYASTLTAADAGTVYYNFYSDITSIKVPYKVQFSYTDRMGNQKYYNKAGYVDPENTSSYTFDENATNVEGVESHSVKVTLTNSFILSLAPYESNFTKNLTWNETPDSNTAFDSSDSKSIASAVVNSTQSDRTIHLNVFRDKDTNEPTSSNNENGNFELFTKNGSSELPYNSLFYTKNSDGTYTYDITAPKTYTDKGKTLQFMYWAIYSDPGCNNLVIKAYNIDGGFSYVSYDNYWIVPVYGESSTPVASVKEVSTSTQFMEVTRNQWTAGNADSFNGFDADSMTTLDKTEDFIKGNGEDKLYADFVLNFFYNGKQLNVFDPNSSKVQTGIVMQKLELEKDSIGVGYNTDMKYYADKYTADLSMAAEDAKSKILTGESSIESLTKQINNNRLNNKNRLQYFARFNNTEANANCVYRVYTYIKYVNESNETVVELGDPIYFTLYDIANATV